jgi:hypothetical protein
VPDTARGSSAPVRLLFLLLVLLGTVGMHTLGHPPAPAPMSRHVATASPAHAPITGPAAKAMLGTSATGSPAPAHH